MMSMFSLLLPCLIICTLKESRAFPAISDVTNGQTAKNGEGRGFSQTLPVSPLKGSPRSKNKALQTSIIIKSDDKREQLGQPRVDSVTLQENSEDIARDINEALRDSEAGREGKQPESQWYISDPEEKYQNQYQNETPEVTIPEEYEISDPSPATFVYKEYPNAGNETFSDGLDNFQEQNELDHNANEDVPMPANDTNLQSYEDFNQGDNIPESVEGGVDTKPDKDMVDGALPQSANQTKGTFSINQGAVTGEGEYQINPEEVEVRVKLHISNTFVSPTVGPTAKPAMCLGPCPTSSPGNKPTTPATLECTGSTFDQEVLNLHNKYRAIHNAPPMTLNCVMNEESMQYAQKLADLDSLVHSSYTERPEQGENLSMGCGPKQGQTAEEAVKKWYDEVCQHTFGIDGPQSGTAHFSQVVWKASVELGVGRAEKDENGQKCSFIVARYKPQGDFDTGNKEYITNVEKGSFDPAYCGPVKQGGLDGGYGFRRAYLGNMKWLRRSIKKDNSKQNRTSYK